MPSQSSLQNTAQQYVDTLTQPSSSLNDLFLGKQEQFNKLKTATPEQEKFAKGLYKSGGGLSQDKGFQQGQSFLQQLLSNDPQAYQAFERPYMENFQQNIAPDIANRFAGMGTGASGLSSSGFQQTLAQAGRGLQSDLAAMRGGLQMQALPEALRYAQQPISNQLQALSFSPFENTHTQGTEGLLHALMKMLPQLAMMAL